MKRSLGCGFVALLVIWGCGGSNTSTTVSPEPLVSFINAATKSAALDAMVNDALIGDNVPYLGFAPKAGNVATFAAFEPAEYDMTVQEDADPETQAVEGAILARDKAYVIFGVGLPTPPNTELDKRLRPVLAEIDRNRPNGDKTRLIIVHAYHRDVDLETPALDFQNPGDNPIVKEPSIGFATTRTTLIDAGDQTFVARRSSSEFDVTPPITFTFGGGKIYAAIICGIENGVGPLAPTIAYVEIQPK